MAKFVKGEIVVIPFPFSDLSGSKRRPALVLAGLPGNDIILSQITSQNSPKDPFAIALDALDFASGSLPFTGGIQNLYHSPHQQKLPSNISQHNCPSRPCEWFAKLGCCEQTVRN